MKDLLKFVIPIVIFFLVMRFFRIFFILIFRFWFVSIPLALLLYLHFRKQYHKKKEFSNLDPDKEIKVYPEPTIDDEE